MRFDDPIGAAVALAELALDVAGQPDPPAMISRVPELAAKLIDCAAADIVRVDKAGKLRIDATSDQALSARTETAWRRWPHQPIPDIATEDCTAMRLQRSSYLQDLTANTGVAQELMVPLRVGTTDHGYLRFLFTAPVAPVQNRRLIRALAAQAAVALDRAALVNEVLDLRAALDSNRDIGAAIGVLMAREHLTYADGLERLKTASQHTNRNLRDLAADILYTGELARPPSSRKP